jgi:hypothetical protein
MMRDVAVRTIRMPDGAEERRLKDDLTAIRFSAVGRAMRCNEGTWRPACPLLHFPVI